MSAFSWQPYGKRGVLVERTDSANPRWTPAAMFAAASSLEHVSECIPGANTLYVESATLEAGTLANEVLRRLSGEPTTTPSPVRTHSIPVSYDGEDLADVAALVGLSVEEVIARHTAPTYTVAFLGFSRGFPYLSGLDPLLVVPRLDSPRTLVPTGSVAMGAGFTGIYPMASPGGWRLLGHTAVEVFDERNEPPGLFELGDQVSFVRFRAS